MGAPVTDIKNATQTGAVEYAAEIVTAYVANNSVGAADLPKLIAEVHAAFAALAGTRRPEQIEKQDPAVPIKKSVTPDYIVCLEDGKKFKSLKRHLSSSFQMTPAEYRTKWGLPSSYPMVAPNYSAERSALAKSVGLGRITKAKAPKKRTSKTTTRKFVSAPA